MEEDGLVEFGITSGSRNHAGTMSFYKDGDGRADFQLDDDFRKENNFSWEVIDENTANITDLQTSILSGFLELTISSINAEDPEFSYEQSAFDYEMERISDDEFSVTGAGAIQALDLDDDNLLVEQYAYEFTMTLTK